MRTYLDLPIGLRSALLLLNFLLTLWLSCDLMRGVRLRRGWRTAPAAALSLLSAGVFMGYQDAGLAGLRQGPAWPYLLLTLVLTAAAVYQRHRSRLWQAHHVSPSSVQESLEQLPMGLCFYWPEGLPRLVNRRLEQLCRDLTGEGLLDGADFWEKLSAGSLPGAVQGGPAPILALPAGTVYSFRRGSILLDGHGLYLITAADVTEEYRLTLELREKERQARIINARLKSLSSTIKYMVMERETFELRASIHDRLGYALLHARRCITSPGSVDRRELLREWRGIVEPMLQEDRDLWRSPWESSMEQAEALGISLHVDGEMPEAHYEIVDAAVTVHLTNVLRHAEGTRADLEIRETEGETVLVFTNDGRPPAGEIRETGGLKNLRHAVEQAGGSMEIESRPVFRMTLYLPKKEANHGV